MMFPLKRIVLTAGLLLAAMFLISCDQFANSGTPIVQPNTLTPLIATPTASPIPEPTSDPQIISPANANQLVLLNYLNKGGAYGAPLYSQDGKWLFQASTEGIYKYDTLSYSKVALLASIPATEYYNPSMTISPDGKTLGTESGELISVDGGQKMFELDPLPNFDNNKYTGEAIFSPDGSMKAMQYNVQQGEPHSFVSVWRLTDGKLLHTFDGKTMGFSADSHLIAVQLLAQGQSHIYLYDLQTGQKIDEWLGERFTFLPDNRLVIQANDYVRIFDIATHKARVAFDGKFASFSSNGEMVATISFNQIKIYRVSDGKFLHKLDTKMSGIGYAILKFSTDGDILVSYTAQPVCCGGMSDDLSVWHVTDGALLKIKRTSPSFDISPNGETLAIRYGMDDVEILRTIDGSLLTRLGGFGPPITRLAFTPDGRQIVTTTDIWPNLLLLYQVDDGPFGIPQVADPGKYVPILRAASDNLKGMGSLENYGIDDAKTDQWTCLVFSPDRQILAVGLNDSSVELWSVSGKVKLFTLPPRTKGTHNNFVGGLAFSPNGKTLAVGLEDGTLRLFGIK